MLSTLSITDVASIITCLGVIFGVPYSIACYKNKLTKNIDGIKQDISNLKRDFDIKLTQVKDELNTKNIQTEQELQRILQELRRSNDSNRVLFKVVKALIDFECSKNEDNENLLRCKNDLDDELIQHHT